MSIFPTQEEGKSWLIAKKPRAYLVVLAIALLISHFIVFPLIDKMM